MKDTFEFTLDNPLTEDQWDMIADVDFDRTDRITFHTKHGKEVEFAKVIRCKDCKHWLPHTQFGYDADYEKYHNYCERHLPDDEFYAFIKEAEDYCSWAERKEK